MLFQSSMSAKLAALRTIRTKRIWLVTGTPFSTQLEQLKPQARLLGIENDLATATRSLNNDELVDWLRARMIRHTKNSAAPSSMPAQNAQTTPECGERALAHAARKPRTAGVL